RHPYPCGHARPRNRGRARRQRARAALLEFRGRHFHRRLVGRAGWRAIGPRADDGRGPADAELHRHHRRRRGVPGGNPGRRVADRRRLGPYRRVLPLGERGGNLRADGGGAADPPARLVRRRGHADVSEMNRKLAILAAIWLALVCAPFWMPYVGGYTALGTRVLVLGLGAMSVNFLLGFTGVLSFGHAAWFGLGAYGSGLALKFIAPSTPLGLL